MIDWGAVNSVLLTGVVILLGWIKSDLSSVTTRVNAHIDNHE